MKQDLICSSQIILHSMHKYQPRVHVIRKDFSSELSPNKSIPTGEGVKTFSFPETVFTTVTAYQNQQVPAQLAPPQPGSESSASATVPSHHCYRGFCCRN